MYSEYAIVPAGQATSPECPFHVKGSSSEVTVSQELTLSSRPYLPLPGL
jgi:hypothetical protein